MTEKQAIWKSILHWRRMIKWVKKQHPKEDTATIKMRMEIKTDWNADGCALCTLFRLSGACSQCPLAKKYDKCSGLDEDKKNAWVDVALSDTWRDWLKAAHRLLKQLESLRGK